MTLDERLEAIVAEERDAAQRRQADMRRSLIESLGGTLTRRVIPLVVLLWLVGVGMVSVVVLTEPAVTHSRALGITLDRQQLALVAAVAILIISGAVTLPLIAIRRTIRTVEEAFQKPDPDELRSVDEFSKSVHALMSSPFQSEGNKP